MSSGSDSGDEVINRVVQRVLARAARSREEVNQEAVPRPIRRRQSDDRDHTKAHNSLYADYFVEDPRWGPTVFRRRFQMRKELFLRIVNGLSVRYPDFQQRWDTTNKPGLSPLQKCTTAIRQLAYGGIGCVDMFDEYLHVAGITGRDCMTKFCKGVIQTFGPTYLRKPTAQDCQFLLNLHGRVNGFPDMLGSVDCMHWLGRTVRPLGEANLRPGSRAHSQPSFWKLLPTSGYGFGMRTS
ncbi:uncharacterized protein LOC125199769, partial [Salvia hispanica]|uniref:uncharacterized protein LOC125199769 n=1 Tax=Salvia hispanica TaxID=49212 RepID=UPI002009B34C